MNKRSHVAHTSKLNVAAAFGGAVLLSGALGCNSDAVVQDEPAGAVMWMPNAGFAGTAMSGAGGAAGAGGTNAGTGGSGGVAGTMGAMGATGGIGGATGGTGGVAGVIAGVGGASGGSGGSGGVAGTLGGMGGASGGSGGASGGTGGATGGMGGGAPGPCPAGWTCEDTSVLGATDKDGKLITGTSCGKGGLIECDDADPAASCPELSNPICAHVFGVTSCTQLCTP